MRTRHRRRATDKPIGPAIRKRVLFILALIAGIIVAGVSGIRTADAVGVHAAGTAAAVEPTHVIALVLLVALFFVTAGLVGVFWYHLIDSQTPKRGRR